MTHDSLVDSFTGGCTAERRHIVRMLVSTVHGAGASLALSIKWNQLTFARDSDFHHWIRALRLTKPSVNLYFHFGGLLEDPRKVLQSGSSKFGRWLTFATEAEIEKSEIKELARGAVKKLPYLKANWKAIQAKGK